MKKLLICLIGAIILFACNNAPPTDKGGKEYKHYITTAGGTTQEYYTNEYEVVNNCITFRGVQKNCGACDVEEHVFTVCGPYQIKTTPSYNP